MVTTTIVQQLNRAGLSVQVDQLELRSSGPHVHVYRMQTEEHIWCVKWNHNGPSDLLSCERDGLLFLEVTGGLRVPRLFEPLNEPKLLVMEWIEGQSTKLTAEHLGRELAQLHMNRAPLFGADRNNYIGTMPQQNDWTPTWSDFFRRNRLEPQLQLLIKHGYANSFRRKSLERIMSQLDRWIDDSVVEPALLHGDFWSGNWVVGPQGQPYWIDPCPFYGDSEYELAFSELFQGFSLRMYASYAELNPVRPGYKYRKQLYQLYFLLVHLNLFGETYGSRVDETLKQLATTVTEL